MKVDFITSVSYFLPILLTVALVLHHKKVKRIPVKENTDLQLGTLQLVTQVRSSCPPNPLDKVQECTATVLPELSQSQGPEAYKTHVQAASETCRNSRLRDVADCMQDILDRCRGTTDQEQMLQRLIDKDKTLATVDYFCRHIRVYERNAECISKTHDETSSCSQEAHKSFETSVNAGANMDVLITGSCRFHAVARGCLTNTTQKYCGQEAASFVYTLLTGQMPPYCEINNPDHRTVDSTYRWDNDDRWQSDQASDDRNNASNVLVVSYKIESLLFVLTYFTKILL